MGMETALSTETANSFDPNKIAADVTTSLITEVVKSGWEKVKKFFKDAEAKDSIDFGDAYACYLHNTVVKNSKIKTLIYRHVPKDLYAFYEYVNVQYQNRKIDTSDIGHLLQISNKLIITGTGGLGKSLLLKHFFLNTAQNSDYIPVLIELRKFNGTDSSEISLYKSIYQSLSDNGFKLEDEYYAYSLNEGAYVILLDGFDEVNRDKVEKVFEQIQSFSDRYNKNHFIVSSRPTDRLMGWNDFHELSLCNLTKKQALHLIQKIDFDKTVKDAFYKTLNEGLFKKYRSFTSNPLLLTIMLLTFNSHAAIPEKLNDFYEQAFLTLFNMHDATKDCFVRDIRSNLGCEDFKIIFAYICFKSFFRTDFEFSEGDLRNYIQQAQNKFNNLSFSIDDFKEDLTLSVCMLVKDGISYRFIHRSFQEYFAAWYTCKLTDDTQSKLLTRWLSESDAFASDKYFEILFNFQPDKVNKIVFCPGIKKMKSLYDKDGFSCNLIGKIFKKIEISEYYIEIDEHYSEENKTNPRHRILSLSIRNKYLINIMHMVCHLNNFSYKQSNEDFVRADQLMDKMLSTVQKKQPSYSFSINKVTQIIPPEDLLYCLKSYDHAFQFCFNLYEKYTKNPIAKKRSVSSIIDEL